MKIRSITYFFAPQLPLNSKQLHNATKFVSDAKKIYRNSPFEVQTFRLATSPFPQFLPNLNRKPILEFTNTLEKFANDAGFDYVAIGAALPKYPDSYPVIPDILANTETTFISGLMTTENQRLSTKSVLACARIINEASQITPDGFANLRFAAMANVPPGVPFFPAAYHSGDKPAFAIAMEAADLVNNILSNSSTLENARQNLIRAFEKYGNTISQFAEEVTRQTNIPFGGIDFTPAPFPTEEASFGTALELLGVSKVGYHGSLAAAAFLTDTLDRANFPRAGFNGLFMPLLEDAVLASRASEGILSLKDLLLYSTVCGTGLDTIPVPGDTSVDALYAVLLDLAVLSLRLDKPLTARLMPIPGKQAGEMTNFNFPYFANSRILAIEGQTINGMLADANSIRIKPRRNRTE